MYKYNILRLKMYVLKHVYIKMQNTDKSCDRFKSVANVPYSCYAVCHYPEIKETCFCGRILIHL
jgi:hypothetical protein